MAVRNFWLEANVDGRKTKLTGGPRSKDGQFDLRIYIRENGRSVRALTIYGLCDFDGILRLSVYNEIPDNLHPRSTPNHWDIVTKR